MSDENVVLPTKAEMRILRDLWTCGPSTVRAVLERRNRGKRQKNRVGYTTTLKQLQVMSSKGMLDCDDRRRTHVYSVKPDYEEKAVQSKAVDFLRSRYCRDSLSVVVMTLLRDGDFSVDELCELKDMIDSRLKEME